jgi:RNA polymerase sigma factor (sigma-70 family)
VSCREPITGWIGGMKSGDDEAIRKIWEHYSPRVVALARERLPVWLRSIVDGDDVANDAMYSVIMGLQGGRFPELHDRDDLWALLACITARKAINQINRALRQKRPPAKAGLPLDEELVAPDPPPDLLWIAAEQFGLLIDCLHRKDELLATIALWKFEGYTNQEIARQLNCSDRRVARKLELIRMTWETEGPR